ncbi:MAG TPA: D-alanine--poly(phosphoribitol) ligase subunit 2 [Chthoniobacterales bacterium]|jgi:D-alanine--poly(phosphoribitol) ligase subunit 2
MIHGPLSDEELHAAVLDLLISITGVDELRTAPDLKIRETGILDSLGIVSLILGLSERFSVEVAPTEIEEENVATPRAIEEFVRRKLASPTP